MGRVSAMKAISVLQLEIAASSSNCLFVSESALKFKQLRPVVYCLTLWSPSLSSRDIFAQKCFGIEFDLIPKFLQSHYLILLAIGLNGEPTLCVPRISVTYVCRITLGNLI